MNIVKIEYKDFELNILKTKYKDSEMIIRKTKYKDIGEKLGSTGQINILEKDL